LSGFFGYHGYVKVFKNRAFAKFADKEGIADGELKDAAHRLNSGQFDANLGGGVYKMRLARQGAGKSGGYRAMVVFKAGETMYYVYGFAKSDRGNVSPRELKALKKAAGVYLSMTGEQLAMRLECGQLTECRE